MITENVHISWNSQFCSARTSQGKWKPESLLSELNLYNRIQNKNTASMSFLSQHNFKLAEIWGLSILCDWHVCKLNSLPFGKCKFLKQILWWQWSGVHSSFLFLLSITETYIPRKYLDCTILCMWPHSIFQALPFFHCIIKNVSYSLMLNY